jgi:hypothetical protein
MVTTLPPFLGYLISLDKLFAHEAASKPRGTPNDNVEGTGHAFNIVQQRKVCESAFTLSFTSLVKDNPTRMTVLGRRAEHLRLRTSVKRV